MKGRCSVSSNDLFAEFYETDQVVKGLQDRVEHLERELRRVLSLLDDQQMKDAEARGETPEFEIREFRVKSDN